MGSRVADDNILPLVLVGGGVYLLYRWFSAPAAAPAAPAPPAAAAPSGSAPAPAAAPVSPGGAFNSLDQIYQRLQASLQYASDPAISYSGGIYQATPYVFASYLTRAGGFDLSAQIPTLFPNGADSKPVSLPQFWSVAAAWLMQNRGLSGMGFYGSIFKMRRA